MNITVTRAGLEHAEIIARFNEAMALETEDKALLPGTILSGVKSMLEDEQLGFYLVALVDDEMAGCLGVTFEWSDWRNGRFWWVQSVYVNPPKRSTGVFSSMYSEVQKLAREDPDACGIRLYVEKENHRAQRTYTHLGMIETEYRIMEEEFQEQQ